VTISLVDRAASQAAKKPFLVADRDWSYGEVAALCEHVAGWAHERHLASGDIVLVALSDPAVTAAIVLGLIRAGLVPAVADPGNTAAEAAFMAQQVSPRAAIVDRALVDRWGVGTLIPVDVLAAVGGSASASGLASRLLGALRPSGDPLDWLRAAPRRTPPAIPPESLAYIVFTSGTTLKPKGVAVSHRALLAHLATLEKQFGYDEKSRILNLLPLNHVDGLIQGPLLAYFCGCTLHRPVSFSATAIDDMLSAVYASRISHFVAVPTILSMILRLASRELDGVFRGGDFRCVVSAAAHLEERLWTAFEQRYGVIVANLYGLTETVTGGLFSGPDDATRRIGTLGRPVGCTIRIVDAGGRDAPPGETGELLMQGPALMSGYVGAPEATAEVLRDGWLHTGDLVFADQDGFIHYSGRRKSLIISGGLNIQPEEVAEVLKLHPAVCEAAVLGEPHPELGEIVVAAVVASGANADDLIAHCRVYLTAYKIPRRILLVPSLPKGPSGKVILEDVRRLLAPPRSADAESASGRLFEIAAATFMVPLTSLSADSTPDNTPGWDSLGHLLLASALEKAFSVTFDPVEIVSINSLADAGRLIAEKTASP